MRPNKHQTHPTHSSQLYPLADPVYATARPVDYRDLLSDFEFAETPWNASFGDARFFYLTGVTDALRLLQESSATFLKLRGHLDAIRVEEDLERWGTQSGVPLNRTIKRERAGEIAILKPTYFYKCVECMLAFERALEGAARLKGKISPLWVYDYMRIVPAIYNIRQFTTEKLKLLRHDYPEFDRSALQATHQVEENLLDDLAGGMTVTRLTALRLKQFIDDNCRISHEHSVGEVRDRPGNRGLGQGPASTHEIVEPDVRAQRHPEPNVDV